MPVPSVLTDLSTNEASNSPLDSETVTATTRPSDYIRAQAALLRRLRAQGAAVASAATVGLGAIADGEYVHVTGTVAINSFGTVAAGIERTLVFDAALTLTHNATSLILPGAANITTAAGDVAIFVSEGAGNWRCKAYQYAKSTSEPTLLTTLTTTALVSSVDFTGLDVNAHKGYRFEIEYINGTATDHGVAMYVNGLVTPTDYYNQYFAADGAAVSAARSNNATVLGVSPSDRSLVVIDLSLTSGGYAFALSRVVRNAGSAVFSQAFNWSRTASISNINSITFAAGVTNGIGVGTNFKIYRKDK